MKKASIIILFLFTLIVFLITQGCERDDICAETTATTPQLILRFYDISDQEDTKNVIGLKAFGLDDLNTVIELPEINVINTDSIVLPLRTDTNQTRFILHREFEIDDNDTPDDNTDDFLTGNPDIITVSYITEQVYVSRACGFKTIFNDFSFSVETETNNPDDDDIGNWISQFFITVPNNTVDNETAAHVNLFH